MEKKHAQAKLSVSADHVCKICSCSFVNLQECLKHELLKHSFPKNRAHKSKVKRLQTVFQTLNDADQKEQQALVEAAVDSCEQGEELKAILKLYCIGTQKLEQSYMHIYTCLQKEIQKIGQFSIYPFGSVANGLALEGSDIDIYIESDDYSVYTEKQIRVIFNRVSSYLFRSEFFSDVVPIRQARVPIIKCKHLPSGYNIDINMSCPSSVNNTYFLRDIIRCDTRLHQLFLFLKVWSKHLQIIGRGGNMSSYCLITLIIFYLQNTSNSKGEGYPILPSVEQLQKHIQPEIVQGVNYAYNLQLIMPLAKHHTVRSLIEAFFLFYHKFDFMNTILSPFLGQQISKSKFIADNFKFQMYKDQLRAISILKGAPAVPLPVQQCMCVQDPFCLHLNVARAVTPFNFEYISNCFLIATKICTSETKHQISDAEFYKLLLYDIVKQVSEIESLKKSQDIATTISFTSSLSLTIRPSRSEMRSLMGHAKDIEDDKDSLQKLWVHYYIELIKDLLADIYNFDIQIAQSTHSLKNQKLDDLELTYSFALNGSVDMWTGRTFEKSTTTFMEHHKQLTNTFQKQRRQNSTYAVELNAFLTLSVLKDYSAIELKIRQMDSSAMDVNKKSPLCKFFRNFKVCIQNCNLNEKLLTASEKLLNGLSNASFINEKDEEVQTETSG